MSPTPSTERAVGTEGERQRTVEAGGEGRNLNAPAFIAFDNAGLLYISDPGNNRVAKARKDGVVSTFAAGFTNPQGVAFDAKGFLYVADKEKGTVDRVNVNGGVTGTV